MGSFFRFLGIVVGGLMLPSVPSGKGGPKDRRLPVIGTTLRRTYRDQAVVVKVLQNGFEYQGRRYSSLSAIARQATGTRWNGLLFFGLTPRGKEKKHVAQ